ncbi:MAG: hypothetical protein KY428_10675, partial [Bacteroidetes bacterium]|nr:hypothetical protein [Bacteroidota bacterium]
MYSLLVLLVFFSCDAKNNKGKPEMPDGETIPLSKGWQSLPYQLNNPQEIYTLPGSLVELSGMQSLSDNLIACVQDEDGVIYLFDREQKKVIREISWGPKGDYEGIAGNSRLLYILRSDGTIFKVSNYNSSSPLAVEKWKTRLDKSCDAEGLFLMDSPDLLLLACKGGAGDLWKIWEFDMRKAMLREGPLLQMSLEVLAVAVVGL